MDGTRTDLFFVSAVVKRDDRTWQGLSRRVLGNSRGRNEQGDDQDRCSGRQASQRSSSLAPYLGSLTMRSSSSVAT